MVDSAQTSLSKTQRIEGSQSKSAAELKTNRQATSKPDRQTMKFLHPTLFLAALREAASADGQSSTIRGQQHQRGLEETSLVTVGNNWTPNNAFPLGRCQGDCDKDSDCSVRNYSVSVSSHYLSFVTQICPNTHLSL